MSDLSISPLFRRFVFLNHLDILLILLHHCLSCRYRIIAYITTDMVLCHHYFFWFFHLCRLLVWLLGLFIGPRVDLYATCFFGFVSVVLSLERMSNRNRMRHCIWLLDSCDRFWLHNLLCDNWSLCLLRIWIILSSCA